MESQRVANRGPQMLVTMLKMSASLAPGSAEANRKLAAQNAEFKQLINPSVWTFCAWAYVEMMPFYLDNLLYLLFCQVFIQPISDQSLKIRLNNDFDALTR